jgi:anti-anti-sigma regulatory factor
VTGIVAAGDFVFDDGVLRIARMKPPPDGLVLAGEADESGYQPLVEALARLAGCDGAGPAEIHLELSGLEFCDAAALRAMIAPAEDGGRRVVLHGPAPALRALIRIVGWDELPGLTVLNQLLHSRRPRPGPGKRMTASSTSPEPNRDLAAAESALGASANGLGELPAVSAGPATVPR